MNDFRAYSILVILLELLEPDEFFLVFQNTAEPFLQKHEKTDIVMKITLFWVQVFSMLFCKFIAITIFLYLHASEVVSNPLWSTKSRIHLTVRSEFIMLSKINRYSTNIQMRYKRQPIVIKNLRLRSGLRV